MVEHGINPGTIDSLFFTHHHIDHNAAFYYFLITNWTRGEDKLSIYGPQPTTDILLSSLYDIYGDAIDYRVSAGAPSELIRDLPTYEVAAGAEFSKTNWSIEAFEVKHSIETHGFRIREHSSGAITTISGDTGKTDTVVDAARDGDLLIQDCGIAPTSGYPDSTGDEVVWEEYTTGIPPSVLEGISDVHCSPEERGEIAAAADVDTLMLTHLLPYRDEQAITDSVKQQFLGTVYVADDGLRLSV